MKLPVCVCSAMLMLVQSNLFHCNWSGLLHGWVQSKLFHWSGLGGVLHSWPECWSRAKQSSWPNQKKLINKTQELPLALNISICSNLINLAMAHTDCQWSWPNPQNESQSPSLYLKKWQAILKPRRFLWMVWWRGPPAQSTQISCWSLTDWPSGVYCLVGWLAQVHPVLSDQQMSKS